MLKAAEEGHAGTLLVLCTAAPDALDIVVVKPSINPFRLLRHTIPEPVPATADNTAVSACHKSAPLMSAWLALADSPCRFAVAMIGLLLLWLPSFPGRCSVQGVHAEAGAEGHSAAPPGQRHQPAVRLQRFRGSSLDAIQVCHGLPDAMLSC